MEKQNAKKVSVIIALIVLVIAVIIILAAVFAKKAKADTERPSVETNTVQEEIKETPKPVEEEKPSFILLSSEQKTKLQKDLKSVKEDLNLDAGETPRSEKITSEKNGDENFSKKIRNTLEALYNKLNSGNSDEDDPFSNVSKGNLKEIESAGGPGLGDNTSASDKPAVDLAVRISFDYGSWLDTKNVYMTSYLKGSQKIMTSADVEYAEFYLALDELLESIPKAKRNKAVFAVVGYADSSFRNGVPDKGPESRKFNTELSYKRAESVINMLVTEKKISPERILPAEGRGFDNLIMEEGKENHEKSRRVEVFCYAK